ncbi:MAG: hypothetical protein HY094_02005 [Candidatus Melainabacteria bacterium]|nr:hypothetical protein [Candidatus Melainabacteria bacterium]
MSDSKYCYLHNPDISEEEKLNAQIKGGKGNTIKITEPLEPVAVEKVEDIVKLLADTINRVRSGEMEIKVANCIGYLSGHLTKALEIAELEKRIEVVERVVLNRK